MSRKLITTWLIVLALLFSGGGANAQGNDPEGDNSAGPAGPGADGTGANGPQAPLAVVGTDFTYQGQLKNSGSPVTATCDMAFRLFDDLSAGTQYSVITTTVPVTNGLFSVGLPMGGSFSGTAFWLDVRVRCPAGTGNYTTLAPRQPLNAAPYAHSLRPGSQIVATQTNWNMIYASNVATQSLSYGLRAVSSSESGGKGVSGESLGANGIGVFGTALNGGAGVYGTAGLQQFQVYTVTDTYGGYFVNAVDCTSDVFSCGKGVVGLTGSGNVTNTHPSGGFYPAGGEFAGPNGIIGAASPEAFDGYGVIAIATGSSGRALYAVKYNTGGYAGYFSGDVHVTGNLSASGTKPFKIDHPSDPANSYLYHYAVESPQVQNMYNGVVTLDANGEAVVQLPDYFAAINAGGFRYDLTPIGAAMPNLHIAEEVQGNSFKVAGGAPGKKVSWMVFGQRNDPWIRAHPQADVVQKPADEQGTYLYPEGYGQPAELGPNAAQSAQR